MRRPPAQDLEELRVADHPAQHVQDPRALAVDDGAGEAVRVRPHHRLAGGHGPGVHIVVVGLPALPVLDPQRLGEGGEALVEPQVLEALAGDQVAVPHVRQFVHVAALAAVLHVAGRHAGAGLVLHPASAGVAGREVLLGEERILPEDLREEVHHLQRPLRAGSLVGDVLRVDRVGDGHRGHAVQRRVGGSHVDVVRDADGNEVGGDGVRVVPLPDLAAGADGARLEQAVRDHLPPLARRHGDAQGHRGGLVVGLVLAGPPGARAVGLAEGVDHRLGGRPVGGAREGVPEEGARGGRALETHPHAELLPGGNRRGQRDADHLGGAAIGVGQRRGGGAGVHPEDRHRSAVVVEIQHHRLQRAVEALRAHPRARLLKRAGGHGRGPGAVVPLHVVLGLQGVGRGGHAHRRLGVGEGQVEVRLLAGAVQREHPRVLPCRPRDGGGRLDAQHVAPLHEVRGRHVEQRAVGALERHDVQRVAVDQHAEDRLGIVIRHDQHAGGNLQGVGFLRLLRVEEEFRLERFAVQRQARQRGGSRHPRIRSNGEQHVAPLHGDRRGEGETGYGDGGGHQRQDTAGKPCGETTHLEKPSKTEKTCREELHPTLG